MESNRSRILGRKTSSEFKLIKSDRPRPKKVTLLNSGVESIGDEIFYELLFYRGAKFCVS